MVSEYEKNFINQAMIDVENNRLWYGHVSDTVVVRELAEDWPEIDLTDELIGKILSEAPRPATSAYKGEYTELY